MTADERRACDGLADHDDTIWLRDHCERLEWELQATANALRDAYAILQRGAAKPPTAGGREE